MMRSLLPIAGAIVSWGIYTSLTVPVISALELTKEAVNQQQVKVSETEMPGDYSVKAEDLLMPTVPEKSETAISLTERKLFTTNTDNPTEIAQLGEDAGTSGWAIVPKAGTLGLGADLVAEIIPHLNGRIGISGLNVNAEVSSDRIDYDGDVSLGGIPLFVDWYPAKSGFRVTGGLVINNNKVELDSQDRDRTVTIGDREFTVSDVGDLEGEVEFNDIAPYIGIGFGNPVKPGRQWGFTVDLGIMFQGKGDVNINATNASQAALDLGLNAQLEREEEDVQDEVDNFQVYPILQIGVTYQF